MIRVAVQPELLRWARERSGLSAESLARRFPKLDRWESGALSPTLKQLEGYAQATHTPVGYFFLAEPPIEPVPIPDLRVGWERRPGRPSADLLETIYICQHRQAWYRDYAIATGSRPLGFVGSAHLDTPVERVAEQMRRELDFDLEARRACPTWTEALRQFIAQADRLGVLVMRSGVVGNNTRRKLAPEEFRGLALADEYAPLVFINGADTRAAQMFTLAHELAHIWLGESALSDATLASMPTHRVEMWCNRVAAELLVPLHALRHALAQASPLAELSRLARRFKVSRLVILRRILDAGLITRGAFERAYEEELARLEALPGGRGGDYYRTQPARLGPRFARALVESTLEGLTLYRDAFRLLGIRQQRTFQNLARSLGYPA